MNLQDNGSSTTQEVKVEVSKIGLSLMWHCSRCGTAVYGSAFCPECGAKLRYISCPECKQMLRGDEKFCPDCGLQQAKEEVI